MSRPIDEWIAEYCMMFGPEQITKVGILEGEAEFYVRMAKDMKSNVHEVIRFIHTAVRMRGDARLCQCGCSGSFDVWKEKHDAHNAHWLSHTAVFGEAQGTKVFLRVVDDVNGVNLPNSRYPGKESE